MTPERIAELYEEMGLDCEQACEVLGAIETAQARIAVLERIDNERITEIMSQEGRADRYRETTREFLSTVLTVKRENEPGWMDYLAERINEVCEVIGEEDRFAYRPSHEALLPIKK